MMIGRSPREGRRWRRENNIRCEQIGGEWLDVGYGACQRCGVERRLYSPVEQLTLKVCAICSQICALSALPGYQGEKYEDLDEGEIKFDEVEHQFEIESIETKVDLDEELDDEVRGSLYH